MAQVATQSLLAVQNEDVTTTAHRDKVQWKSSDGYEVVTML